MATASTKDIKRRQKSIENTMKITKAMELVAFSKLRKSKQQVSMIEPFFNGFYSIMQNLSKDRNFKSIVFDERDVRRRCYIIISGDRGLAGSYNGNILRYAENELSGFEPNDIDLILIGKKSINFFRNKKFNILEQYENIAEDIDISFTAKLSEKIIAGYISGSYQEVKIIFTDFLSVLSQKPMTKRILPVREEKSLDSRNINIIYDPSPGVVLDTVIDQYVSSYIYMAVVRSFAAEQGARRIAMESANKSAKEMLQDINLMFNKARQASITQEITEIAAGAGAL